MMANLIAKPLTDGTFSFRKAQQASARVPSATALTKKHIVRIVDKFGGMNYVAKEGKHAKPRTNKCFICRQYDEKDKDIMWKCRVCDMSLCQMDSTNVSCKQICLDEHLCSDNDYIGCRFIRRGVFQMPDHLKQYTLTRSQRKKKDGDEERERMQRRKGQMVNLTPSPPRRSLRKR